MRGGTLLHKAHLAPASRYSEDIDLVVGGTRPEGHVRRAIRRVLTDVWGEPKTTVWGTLKLALRNTVQPSRVLRMTYYSFRPGFAVASGLRRIIGAT